MAIAFFRDQAVILQGSSIHQRLDYPKGIVVGETGMRRISLLAISTLAFMIGGCQFLPGGGEPSAEDPVEEPVSEQTVEVPVAGETPTEDGQAPFAEPTVEATATPPGNAPDTLIASTNPASRLQRINSDRSDPFALLPLAPIVQIPPALPEVPTPPAVDTAATNPPATNPGNATSNPGSPGNSNSPSEPETPVAAAPVLPPPPPSTDLAQSVEVTGVVQVGDTLYAIVNAPNEPSSRYVQVGQRLANGQVLVKRIDATALEPIVIFEQNGVEIVRAVGEGGAPADEENETA